jgi:hypothetical protein
VEQGLPGARILRCAPLLVSFTSFVTCCAVATPYYQPFVLW